MNLPNARRALWVAATASFSWLVVAYYDDHPLQMIIAAGLFVLSVPVDRLLHLEINTRQRHPSPFGPVNKFGMREEVFHTQSPHWANTRTRASDSSRRPAEWWTDRDLAEIMTAGRLEYSNRNGTRSVDLQPGPTARRRPTWWRRIVGHWFPWIMSVGLVLGYALYGAAHANADTIDHVYLITLDHFDVEYTSGTAAIAAGHSICDAFDTGASLTAVGVKIMRATGLSADKTGYIIGAAVGAYCDEYEYLLRNAAHPPAIRT